MSKKSKKSKKNVSPEQEVISWIEKFETLLSNKKFTDELFDQLFTMFCEFTNLVQELLDDPKTRENVKDLLRSGSPIIIANLNILKAIMLNMSLMTNGSESMSKAFDKLKSESNVSLGTKASIYFHAKKTGKLFEKLMG